MAEDAKWYKKLSDKFWENYEQLDSDVNSEPIIKERKSTKMKEFVGGIYIKLGQLLDEQVYVKQNGEIVVPPQIVVFLNDKDDKDWHGAKRLALIEDIQNICSEKLKEMAESPISIKPIGIELKVDGTMKEGNVRVMHLWEDNRTQTPPVSEIIEVAETNKDKETQDDGQKDTSSNEKREMTIPYSQISNQVFHVEIWRNDKMEKELSFHHNQVTIGRNSVSKGNVDINLDNPLVGRKHATLEMDDKGNFWITANNDNPTKVGDFTVPKNRTVQVGNNQPIQIIEFTIRVRK